MIICARATRNSLAKDFIVVVFTVYIRPMNRLALFLALFVHVCVFAVAPPNESRETITNQNSLEMGFTAGFPIRAALGVGLRNLLGTGLFTKVHLAPFLLAAALEAGWSWDEVGDLRQFVSATYSKGTWKFVAASTPLGTGWQSNMLSAQYGIVAWQFLTASAGLTYGFNGSSDFTGLRPAAQIGASWFF